MDSDTFVPQNSVDDELQLSLPEGNERRVTVSLTPIGRNLV